MRILFFCHYFPPEVNAPASRTYEHCLRWAKAGHDVTVITCQPNCPDGVLFPGYKNHILPQKEMVDGIRVVRCWTYLAPNAGTVRRIANYVSYMVSAVLACLFVRRPDVIISTSPQFFCAWAGVFASWLKWSPLVVEIRDIWPESIVAVGAMKDGPLLRVLEWLERVLYRSAKHIVTVGEGYKQRIEEKVPLQGRISVITNGVDLEFFKPASPDAEWLARWGLEGKFVCSYVGTIGMAHGLEIAIEASRRLRDGGRDDIAFCLVGDGASRKRLQQQVAEADLSSYVVFTGRQPKEEMPRVLASSQASLIHLKKCELFEGVIPSKIFETMAMKVPMIMGVSGESRAIVNRAGAGIDMEPDNADELVAAVQRLADTPELAKSLGQSGRDFVHQYFNRDALAASFLELLESIVERRTITPVLSYDRAAETAPEPVAAESSS